MNESMEERGKKLEERETMCRRSKWAAGCESLGVRRRSWSFDLRERFMDRRSSSAASGSWTLIGAALVTACLLLSGTACDSGGVDEDESPRQGEPASILNLRHLDHLMETVEKDGVTYGIVHIYSEAPNYGWVADDDEGAAAVDDAARAAVVYLRHFELTGEKASRQKAETLVRFIMYMQTDDGRFFNFVWNSELEVNRAHQNSVADEFGWWAARGVWALGTCARVLKGANQALSEACARRVRRTYPHIREMMDKHGQTTSRNGRVYPRWLISESAADATSELLLGLVSMREAYPDDDLNRFIPRLLAGIQMMQFGDLSTYPYGAHASWLEIWHGWGNSQTQAAAESRTLASARHEAEHFYPHLIVDGWMHSMPLDDPQGVRKYEQIAYAVRCVSVGLIRLFETTGEERYAILAGLAASWFMGNNVAGADMYDPETGRGFDGINGPDQVNRNAGAESTIEANYTILEVEQHATAHRWMHAASGPREEKTVDGKQYAYRVFTTGEHRIGVALNLTDTKLEILDGETLAAFLES